MSMIAEYDPPACTSLMSLMFWAQMVGTPSPRDPAIAAAVATAPFRTWRRVILGAPVAFFDMEASFRFVKFEPALRQCSSLAPPRTSHVATAPPLSPAVCRRPSAWSPRYGPPPRSRRPQIIAERPDRIGRRHRAPSPLSRSRWAPRRPAPNRLQRAPGRAHDCRFCRSVCQYIPYVPKGPSGSPGNRVAQTRGPRDHEGEPVDGPLFGLTFSLRSRAVDRKTGGAQSGPHPRGAALTIGARRRYSPPSP